MRNATILSGLILSLGFGSVGAFSADPPKADAPEAKSAAAAETKELKLPPGWRKKKRGKYVLFCKKEAPMGTRIKADTCYDEKNMRNYILAMEENKGDIDRIRSTCANQCACGNPAAC